MHFKRTSRATQLYFDHQSAAITLVVNKVMAIFPEYRSLQTACSESRLNYPFSMNIGNQNLVMLVLMKRSLPADATSYT